ncbi:MAG: thiolase family protein [Paracoccaceae bacterium]
MAKGSMGAIAGLGITRMSREWMGPAPVLAADAIRRAIEDAGLEKKDIDGLLINAGLSSGKFGANSLTVSTQNLLGLRDMGLTAEMVAQGSTTGQMVQYAMMAIEKGMCNAVVCVYADAPMQPGTSAGGSYGMGRVAGAANVTTMDMLDLQYGMTGANAMYGLAARRHMALYGTTQESFAEIAISNRQWATMNPHAIYRDPLSFDEYFASRWIAEPFRLYDCTMVNNGAVAVVVTSAERAKDLKQPPVHVLGMGQGHPGNPKKKGYENEVNSGAQQSGKTAFRMAGITKDDVDICELYDCYTYTTLVTLEDYGFCAKGEGGEFVKGGTLAPGGALPTNTGGGQLSAYYMWGMTPLSEAVIQARGQGGERQVKKNDIVLVSSQGGLLDHHATLIVSPHETVH